jgi:uncharacterized membrane protein YphA (DoxX/SURF4 family)
MKNCDNCANFLMRLFLGIGLVYLAVAELFFMGAPSYKAVFGYHPTFAFITGVVLLVLGVLLILGLITKIAAWATFILLAVAIIASLTMLKFNIGFFAKDLVMFGVALALAMKKPAYALDNALM